MTAGPGAAVRRSELSVPSVNRRMVEKALATQADVVMLDMEDSVPAAHKVEAREAVVRAMRELDWRGRPAAYRVNAADTPYFYRDVIDVVEQAGDALGLIIMPKVDRAEDVILLDMLLRGIEMNVGLEPDRIRVEAQIESARGLVNVDAIAAAPRLDALIFGPGDFAATMAMPVRSIGARDEWDDAYPGHRFHYAMARIAVAAHAAGIQAIDGPIADYRDLDAYRVSAIAARGLGYGGKWCIHPDQIPIANEVFSPTDQEIAWATRVVDAYRQAVEGGQGVISVDNTMIDEASIRMAEWTLNLARRAGRGPGAS